MDRDSSADVPNRKKRRGPYGRKNYENKTEIEVGNIMEIEILSDNDDIIVTDDVMASQNDNVTCTSKEKKQKIDVTSEDGPDCSTFNAVPACSTNQESFASNWMPETSEIKTICDLRECSELDSVLENYIQEEFSIIAEDESEHCINAEDLCEDNDYDLDNVDVEMNITENTEDEFEDVDNQPLYPGSSVTLGAFMLLLAMFSSKFNLTGDGIQQILQIIAFVLPNDHLLYTSLYKFKTYFKSLKNPLIRHYYCCHCLTYITDRTSMNQCPNKLCEKQLTTDTCAYFLEIPLVNQLRNFFSQKNFYDNLQGRFSRKTKSGHYEDIYDGNLYKSYFHKDGPLNCPDNISFVFNTDGAPVFNSSKVSIWPIFLVINELPYHLRMKKENMILAGLWFGNKKPLFGTFLKPFIDSFKQMNDGFNCESPERGKFVCKAYLMVGTMDLPARCILCNSMQYNGAFGCWKCKQRGETCAVGKGHAHVFPYMENDPKGPIRSHDSVIEDSKKAVADQKHGKTGININGVKGPSWLLLIPRFDIIHGIAIDYMHGVLLGVQKLLLNLWFAQKHSSKHFSIYRRLEQVDKRLLNIRPTLEITRIPRSIGQELKYWKASEYRAFLLFYGAPVLFGILDSQRFSHYLRFVNAIHILLTCGSSDTDINRAETFLLSFCQQFDKLYDKCFMTLNIHQLVHLADSVRCLGPLYTHSCFSFEDKNGFILKMIRGTQNIDNQILTGVSFVQKLPELKQKCIPKHSEVEKLYQSIDSYNCVKRGKQIGHHMYVLGSTKSRKLTADEFDALAKFLRVCPLTDSLTSFIRLEVDGCYVYGMEYARMMKRNNSVVRLRPSNNCLCRFGQVRYFAELLDDASSTSQVIAFLEGLSCVSNANTPILHVTHTQRVSVVPVTDILETCVFVEIPDSKRNYVCIVPNRLECD